MDNGFTAVLDEWIDAEALFDGMRGAFSDVRNCIAAIDLSKEVAVHEMVGEAARAPKSFHDGVTAYLLDLASKAKVGYTLRRAYGEDNAELTGEWAKVSGDVEAALCAVEAACARWFPDMDWGARTGDDGSAEYLVQQKAAAVRARLACAGECVEEVLNRRLPEICEAGGDGRRAHG